MIAVLLATAAAKPPPVEVTIPVPVAPPPHEEERFDYCTRLTDAARGKQKSVIETDDGQLGLRCERTGDDVDVCLVFDPHNWPTRFPRTLSCEVGRARIEVHPYGAWDPTWTLDGDEPLWIRVGKLSTMRVTWALPAGPWTSASADGPVQCALTDDGQLRLTVTPPVTFGEVSCILKRSDGQTRTIPVHVRRRK